jgi:hypothetical protein
VNAKCSLVRRLLYLELISFIWKKASLQRKADPKNAANEELFNTLSSGRFTTKLICLSVEQAPFKALGGGLYKYALLDLILYSCS